MANSPKYHELTTKIWNLPPRSGNIDIEIRSYLEACAEKLSKEGLSGIIYWEEKTVREILGLGDVKSCKGHDHLNECDCSPKQTGFSGNVKDSSQKTIVLHNSIDCQFTHTEFPKNWFYCPYCAAAKLKPLSLEERLAQYLYEEFEDKHKVRLFEVERPVQAHYMKLAGKVITWLKEN